MTGIGRMGMSLRLSIKAFKDLGDPWRASVTYILILVNLTVFIILNIILGEYGYIDGGNIYLYTFGQVNSLILRGEALYQLFTSIFIHITPIHILMNMSALWFFGRYVEKAYNSIPYIILYITSGLLGNILTLALGPNIISAGASGSVFGVLGAYVAIFRGDPRLYVVVLLYAILILLSSSGPAANPAAHLGGFIAGLILGRLLIALKERSSREEFYWIY
jgi:rhomboid protease GluP